MQIQLRAFGAKCGALGASGEPPASATGGAASRPLSFKSDATASRPTPLAEVARKLRRDCRRASCAGCMMSPRSFLPTTQEQPLSLGHIFVEDVHAEATSW